MTPDGGSGIRGILSGGIVLSAVGVAGVGSIDVGENTEPGGGGWAFDAVELCVPGSTTVSESWIRGFVLGSSVLVLISA